jgi:AAHS family 4-hydroxybenzoate transporter-like MFS transporter
LLKVSSASVRLYSEAQIEAVLDRKPLSAIQVRTLVMVLCATILEGIDSQLLSFASPSIIMEWKITKAQLGPPMAAALLGMALGTAIGGRLGDKYGRKPLIIWCIGSFGTLTLLAGLAHGITTLTWLRLIAGIGFGAALSNAPTLISEWMPARLRNETVTLTVIGVPVGGMTGAAVASWLIPAFGWRVAFWVGGAIPLLLVLAMIAMLRESPKYLGTRKERVSELSALLRRISGIDVYPETSPNKPSSPGAGSAGHTDIVENPRVWHTLISLPYRRTTIGLGIASFSNLTINFAFFSWIPTMLASLGLPLSQAIRGSFYFSLVGVIGALACSRVISKVGSKTPMLAMAGLGFVAVSVFAVLLQQHEITPPIVDPWFARIGLPIIGLATVAIQGALYVLAALAYPTPCRATATGLANTSGRIGGIASALSGGAILSLAEGPSMFLAFAAALYVITGLGVLIVNRHSKGALG